MYILVPYVLYINKNVYLLEYKALIGHDDISASLGKYFLVLEKKIQVTYYSRPKNIY